jgi:hypothetical protein
MKFFKSFITLAVVASLSLNASAGLFAEDNADQVSKKEIAAKVKEVSEQQAKITVLINNIDLTKDAINSAEKKRGWWKVPTWAFGVTTALLAAVWASSSRYADVGNSIVALLASRIGAATGVATLGSGTMVWIKHKDVKKHVAILDEHKSALEKARRILEKKESELEKLLNNI